MSDRERSARVPDARTLKIRRLNDHLRMTWSGGRVFLSPAVEQMGPLAMLRALRLVRDFDEFGHDEDPLEERDFGAIVVGGEQLFWKIEYFDSDAINGSPDPADEAVTRRVLTILKASEW